MATDKTQRTLYPGDKSYKKPHLPDGGVKSDYELARMSPLASRDDFKLTQDNSPKTEKGN